MVNVLDLFFGLCCCVQFALMMMHFWVFWFICFSLELFYFCRIVVVFSLTMHSLRCEWLGACFSNQILFPGLLIFCMCLCSGKYVIDVCLEFDYVIIVD